MRDEELNGAKNMVKSLEAEVSELRQNFEAQGQRLKGFVTESNHLRELLQVNTLS